MRGVHLAALIGIAAFTVSPCWAQGNTGQGNNAAAHNWNTNAFAVHPPANTNAFAKRPAANTNAFAKRPAANENAFAGRHGNVTAFGSGNGPTTNAFGNTVTGTNNANRLAGSFGTATDHRASPVGPNTAGGGNGSRNGGS